MTKLQDRLWDHGHYEDCQTPCAPMNDCTGGCEERWYVGEIGRIKQERGELLASLKGAANILEMFLRERREGLTKSRLAKFYDDRDRIGIAASEKARKLIAKVEKTNGK